MLKAKFDWLSFFDTATDVKTTLSASPDKFRQKIADLSYCLQDSFYCYVASLLGIKLSTFTFVAVEFMHANICQPYQLNESRRKKSQIELAKTLNDFQWCLEHNKWYGYQREDCTIILD
jgi:exodeoxyribonuclease VIII